MYRNIKEEFFMWEEILQILTPTILTILGTILTGIATIVGLKVRQLVKQIEIKTGIEIDEKQAREAVEWAEQVYKDSGGEVKFEKAKDRLILIMNERGIPVSEKVIDTLIEQAVFGLKKGWKNLETNVEQVTIEVEQGIENPEELVN